ncbi:MAG TPA: uridine diphosphate-N-acetylglucosamine-binding protein YvcK [Firmicutes bacterium]|nr:uridine diphosphate-N-acetylglucosamine-binding protein YvcK [Bacillota bacterium]
MKKNRHFGSWLFLFLCGVAFLFGAAFNLLRIYRVPLRPYIPAWIAEFINTWGFFLILIVLGIAFLWLARDRYRRMMGLLRRRRILAERTAKETEIRNGVRVAAIGGGTGLSTILRGLKTVTYNASAIVTVTDDGGSSGRIIEGSDALPPGDIRNCLVALSAREGTLEQLFNYRMENPAELKGHCLGNILISGLAEMKGDMAAAVWETGRILNIRGKVIPVTMDKVTLCAEMEDGSQLKGETTLVGDHRAIRAVFLEPSDVAVNRDAIDAIMEAEIVLLGPGSLYTSILPNLLVPGIVDALKTTAAPVYYVANMMQQAGETEGYDLSDHIEAITAVSDTPFLRGVIVNTAEISDEMLEKYAQMGLEPVVNDMIAVKKYRLKVVGLPLVKEEKIVKHDAEVLAKFIARGRY